MSGSNESRALAVAPWAGVRADPIGAEVARAGLSPLSMGLGPGVDSGVVGELAVPAVVLGRQTVAGALDEIFRADEALRCVVLQNPGDPGGPVLVDRLWFERLMTGPLGFGRALHKRRPVMDLGPTPGLVFDASDSVAGVAAEVVGGANPQTMFNAVSVAWPDGRVGVAHVASIFERLAQHHAYQSLHDPLTGLPNRLMLMQNLKQTVAEGSSAVVLYIDLDRFKDVNDQFGHGAGDQVLVQFAKRLRSISRADDLVLRLGGDEFAVLTRSGLSSAMSSSMAQRLVLAASAPYVVTVLDAAGRRIEQVVTLGASVGVAHSDGSVAPSRLTSLEVLLKQADLAMYRAKAHGRGRVAYFDSELQDDQPASQDVRDRRTMERRLRSAIDDGALEVHYQPLVELPSGRVTGVEALARWKDSELGSVPPDQFIPLAETTGLIIDLGRWVLNTACLRAATWQRTDSDRPGPTIAVNVSPVQLTESTFIQDVVDVLAASGLPADRLCIEITETAAISDMEKTARVLARLRELGVQIALDDFGTGHSSLTMLRRLPVTQVKIDRSFITKIATDAQDAVLVRLIIDAAHSLGMRVYAEGIEDASQASQIIAMGCDFAQGWFFGRPQPASPDLTQILAGVTTDPTSPDQGQNRLALTGNGELVLVSSATHLVTYVSATSTTILGWTPAELIGTPIVDHLHPQDLATDLGESELPPFLREGTATHRIRHRDGSYRWLQSTSQHLYDDTEQIREVLTVCQDVTAVMSAQLALASSEDRFRHAFDDAPFGMALTGMDGTFLRVNTAFADFIGAHPDQLLTMSVDDITHPDDRLADAANLAAYTNGQATTHDITKRYQRIDGATVTARVRAAHVLNRDGTPAYVIAHITASGCDHCGHDA